MTDLWTDARVGRRVLVASDIRARSGAASEAVRGCLVFGWVLLILGATAMGCTLSPHPFDQQVFRILGFDHTFVLGLVELVTGSILLAAATSRRSATRVGIGVGLTMWIAGIVALAETRTVADVFGATATHGCA
ncbi:MAG: hypothetical protein AB7V43_21115, partial [Acidimicrobiia bacterium]